MLQQLKLFARKIHRLAATQDLVAAQVHLDIAEGIAILLFRERLRPTQNSLHASQQFPDRKGLGDVVVGTELEAYNLIHFLADRKSTRLNSSHVAISYAVFCLKKKNICMRLSNLMPIR